MNQQEANKLIAEKVSQAYALIRECEHIADEACIDFSFDLAYGMGGYYQPDHEDWESSSKGEWVSSSSQC